MWVILKPNIQWQERFRKQHKTKISLKTAQIKDACAHTGTFTVLYQSPSRDDWGISGSVCDFFMKPLLSELPELPVPNPPTQGGPWTSSCLKKISHTVNWGNKLASSKASHNVWDCYSIKCSDKQYHTTFFSLQAWSGKSWHHLGSVYSWCSNYNCKANSKLSHGHHFEWTVARHTHF